MLNFKIGFPSNYGEASYWHYPKSSPHIPTSDLPMKNIRPTCHENLTQFLLNTTFHGLKFVGTEFLFLSAFITAFVIALYFIFDVYNKWDNSPVIVGISPFAIPIGKMPFPAITICNVNQVLKSKVESLLNNSFKGSLVLELCNQENDIDAEKLGNLNFTTSVKDFEDFFVQVSQPCHKLVTHCVFGGVKQNCTEIFQPLITDEGLCCTFNKLHTGFFFKKKNFFFFSYRLDNVFAQDGAFPVNWTSSSGYVGKLPKKYYPRPGVGIGVSNGLSIVLDAEVHEYFCSFTHGAGFKISIHSPNEIPNAKETGLLIGVGMEARIRVNVKITEATNAVRSIQRKYRQCIFEEESELLSYAVYSKRNCNMECDAKRLYKKCKCIDYYMPHIYSNITTCGLKDILCIKNGTNVYLDPNDPVDNEYIKCNAKCLPGCFDYVYKGDMFVSPIISGKFKLKNKFIEEMDPELVRSSITILNFFYTENSFHPDSKDQFIGMTEFLSYTGGLMGLFLGFSTISIIEIIYFCTFRPYCARYRYNKELKSMTRQETEKGMIVNFNQENVLKFHEQFNAIKPPNKIDYRM
ncbi:pickpocket protein 28-like [Condylostylus longicornis]|uniref:pickpocket protein 28-like n=1 Tax=Condylostylus longicornis TaxID=2530218 RepID=UPI00244DB00E|nr:pickpocket protein 28-like [Condylostylus longicornis]